MATHNDDCDKRALVKNRLRTIRICSKFITVAGLSVNDSSDPMQVTTPSTPPISPDCAQRGDPPTAIGDNSASAAMKVASEGGERAVERKTLSVRRVVRVGEDGLAQPASARPIRASSTARPAAAGEAGSAGAPAAVGAAVPLKRLTAGRKEISILHDGSTYLLRVTKSNKLILTKA